MFVIFVLTTGMIMSVYDDVFALSDKGLEKGKAVGCEKGTAKKNPHCNNVVYPPIPENSCDINNDRAITEDELPAGYTIAFIHAIESTVLNAGGGTNDNDIIDTLDEWIQIQYEQPGFCLS